jgi:hypothetical protein
MSDSLRASVEKLKQSTNKLNKIADDAAQVVLAMEAFLNKECSVGIEAYVRVASEKLDDHGMEEITALGYTRWEGKYRIIVSIGIDVDQERIKPWSEWDRTTKLLTVKKLPELVEKIAEVVNDHVIDAQDATAAVADVLKALDRKGGK